MFTGIIEDLAKVTAIHHQQSNITFTFEAKIGQELKIDQSVSHNGVCLTVESVNGNSYTVTAIDETLKKTNLGDLKNGDVVNLERCMPAGGRFDGHIVQGHVDQTGICTAIEDQNGSWLITFEHDTHQGNITVEKGSICVNGVSLTVVNSTDNTFSVAIIPYTWDHTGFHTLKVGSVVNLEFDILGKYIQKILAKRN